MDGVPGAARSVVRLALLGCAGRRRGSGTLGQARPVGVLPRGTVLDVWCAWQGTVEDLPDV